LSVICDEKKRGKEGCRGAPDLVAEIVSPSNSAMEMQRKFDLYRKAGVREYWVVYPEFKTATVYAFRSAGVDTRFYGSGDTVSVGILPGLAVSLESVFAE
ncbi:MAG: Uma2 family endonuclease, partial [Spirochaetaceae bacterium]|nr:Uma2 family endonuclease [Spirochaetaceae bacterium]